MSTALISQDIALNGDLGLVLPSADQIIYGHVFGKTIRDTLRSMLPRLLEDASFKGSPAVADKYLACSRAAGVRLAGQLPQDWTIIAVAKNHILPVGDINTLVSNIGLMPGGYYINGQGLALAGAFGSYSICTWYETASEIKQGAYVSLAGVGGSDPQFFAGTISGTTTTVYAGINDELVSSTATVSGRTPSAWANKPAYVGTDMRALGANGAANPFDPHMLIPVVLPPMPTAQINSIYRFLKKYLAFKTGLTLQ